MLNGGGRGGRALAVQWMRCMNERAATPTRAALPTSFGPEFASAANSIGRLAAKRPLERAAFVYVSLCQCHMTSAHGGRASEATDESLAWRARLRWPPL